MQFFPTKIYFPHKIINIAKSTPVPVPLTCYSSASRNPMSTPAPISESQLHANRQNAQHSTGPRTESGKSRTRLNGLRHGLTGQTVLMPDDDREAYDRFCASTLQSLEPATDAERALAQSIADATWRLNRARAIEENIFSGDLLATSPENDIDAALTQAQTWLDRSRELNLLSVYAGRISRTIDKTKRELLDLQNQRKQAEQAAREEAILLLEYNEATAATEPAIHVNGFAFSTAEIIQIIHRRRRLAQAIAHAKTLKKAA